MDEVKMDVADFHAQVVSAARKRNAAEQDVKDPREFEDLMQVVEELGGVAQRAAKAGLKPPIVGRAMQFYAKCVAHQYGAEAPA